MNIERRSFQSICINKCDEDNLYVECSFGCGWLGTERIIFITLKNTSKNDVDYDEHR